MTCTSHTINTTRPLDSGSLDMMKYELYSSWYRDDKQSIDSEREHCCAHSCSLLLLVAVEKERNQN